MKKLSVLIAAVVLPIAMNAQQPVKSMSFQPKIGMSVSTIAGADDAKSRIGLAAGGEFMYQVSDVVGISFGAIYSQQGAKGTYDSDGITWKMDYINVPILANMYSFKGFAVKAGLQASFKVSNKVSMNGVTVDADKFGAEINTTDLSIPVGMSYEFNNIVVEARYNFGLTNIMDTKNLGYEESESCKNSVFQFTIGYKIGWKN